MRFSCCSTVRASLGFDTTSFVLAKYLKEFDEWFVRIRLLREKSNKKPKKKFVVEGYSGFVFLNSAGQVYTNYFYKLTVKWYKFWYKTSVVSFYTTKS